MNNVTTNIQIPKEDYLRLKGEAARRRTSFSAIVREKIKQQFPKRSSQEIQKIMTKRDSLSQKLGSKLKNFDVVKALREMRTIGK